MRSIKEVCLSRLIFFGETSLRKTITVFLEHYHTQWNHQGRTNQILLPNEEVGHSSGEIHRPDRLGGLLRHYYRKAA